MTLVHIAGLNRGVTQIMGGSFRRELNLEVVTFSTRLAVQSTPMFKIDEGKIKMAAFYFCILPSDCPNSFTPLFRSSSMPLSKHNVCTAAKNDCCYLETVRLTERYNIAR